MCCVSWCSNKHTGSVCIICEKGLQRSVQKGLSHGMPPMCILCTCAACRCPCAVYFGRSKWQEVEIQTAEEKQAKEEQTLAKYLKVECGKQSKLSVREHAVFPIVNTHLLFTPNTQLLILCFSWQRKQPIKTNWQALDTGCSLILRSMFLREEAEPSQRNKKDENHSLNLYYQWINPSSINPPRSRYVGYCGIKI